MIARSWQYEDITKDIILAYLDNVMSPLDMSASSIYHWTSNVACFDHLDSYFMVQFLLSDLIHAHVSSMPSAHIILELSGRDTLFISS